MMLSVMVVGAGAAFSDQSKIKNTEAVDANLRGDQFVALRGLYLFYLYRSTNFGRLHVRCGFVAVGDFIGNFRERDIDFGEGVGI